MVWFWIAAALLAGGAALLVVLFARKESQAGEGEDPALAVHRRQLLEIEELAERGLFNPDDRSAARAEAARRLLSSAARGATPEAQGSRASGLAAAVGAAGAAVLALGAYFVIGAVGSPDQPYLKRLAQWRKSDPATLDAPKMAAVLQTIAKDRPDDPEVWGFLGRTKSASGDPYGAEKAFERAATLAPDRPEFQVLMAEAILDLSDGRPSPEAESALKRALVLDPSNLPARYSLGRIEISLGQKDQGLALWRGVYDTLAPADPRRAAFGADIQRVAAGGPLDAPQTTADAGASAPQAAFIRGMVANLAAKLATNPNDAEGWARLVRSYGVLHDPGAQNDALAKARRQFSTHPDLLAPIEREAKDHPA